MWAALPLITLLNHALPVVLGNYVKGHAASFVASCNFKASPLRVFMVHGLLTKIDLLTTKMILLSALLLHLASSVCAQGTLSS